AHARERFFGDAVHAPRRVESAELGHTRDPRQAQPIALTRGDAGHERQVVVLAPALFTALPPTAHAAVFDRIRIALARSAARYERLQAPLGQAGVSGRGGGG